MELQKYQYYSLMPCSICRTIECQYNPIQYFMVVREHYDALYSEFITLQSAVSLCGAKVIYTTLWVRYHQKSDFADAVNIWYIYGYMVNIMDYK